MVALVNGRGVLGISWGVLAVVAIAYLSFFKTDASGSTAWDRYLSGGGFDSDTDTVYAIGSPSVYATSLTVSVANTSAMTLNNDNPKAQVITLTNTSLATSSTRKMNFTIALDRIDQTSDANSAYPVYTIRPVKTIAGFHPFNGKITTGTTYYTADYSTTTGLYDINIDGKGNTISNVGVKTTVQQGTTDSSIVEIDYSSAVTYSNEGLTNIYDQMGVGKFEIVDPSGEVESTVSLIYIKSA